MPAREVPDQAITLAAAGALLGIGPERVRQLSKAGYIPRPAPGVTSLHGAVRGYIRYLKDAAARAGARAAHKATERAERPISAADVEAGLAAADIARSGLPDAGETPLL